MSTSSYIDLNKFMNLSMYSNFGNKKGVHKVGASYYTINNLHSHLNYKLSNIYLLALCFNVDVFQFGINPVLNEGYKNFRNGKNFYRIA